LRWTFQKNNFPKNWSFSESCVMNRKTAKTI